jgi:hypothetical protein
MIFENRGKHFKMTLRIKQISYIIIINITIQYYWMKIFFSHNCYKLKFVYGECGKKVGMQNTKTLFCMEKNRPYAKSGACQ